MVTTDETVLVVEDETELADIYEAWLSPEYEVKTAYDGTSALERLDDDVDCVVLDRRMPDMTGDAVLERIRGRGFDCPVAMVTAVDPDFDIVEMGFTDYLQKPVSKDDLCTLIEDLLLLRSYDVLIQRYYRLATTIATLETGKTEAQLEESDRFQDLVATFDEVRKQADERGIQLGETLDLSKIFHVSTSPNPR